MYAVIYGQVLMFGLSQYQEFNALKFTNWRRLWENPRVLLDVNALQFLRAKLRHWFGTWISVIDFKINLFSSIVSLRPHLYFLKIFWNPQNTRLHGTLRRAFQLLEKSTNYCNFSSHTDTTWRLIRIALITNKMLEVRGGHLKLGSQTTDQKVQCKRLSTTIIEN